MGSNHRGEYPPDWRMLATQVKTAAGWRCVRCGHPHERPHKPEQCDASCDFHRHPEWGLASQHPDKRSNQRYHAGDFWVRVGRRRQRVLTVAHLDDNKANCAWWNLAALCQVCHLQTQGKIEMGRPWMLEHSKWFRPYVAGFYAATILGEQLTRLEVMARLEELLALGRGERPPCQTTQ